MKIIKSKSMMFLLVFLFIFTAVFSILKKTRLYTFTDKNKNDEYKLIHNIEGKFLLSSNDSFERIDKVGENDNYFAIFFLSRRNEKVETPSSELLPLVEVGASWEVCAFVSHIYLPSSSGSPYPDIFF